MQLRLRWFQSNVVFNTKNSMILQLTLEEALDLRSITTQFPSLWLDRHDVKSIKSTPDPLRFHDLLLYSTAIGYQRFHTSSTVASRPCTCTHIQSSVQVLLISTGLSSLHPHCERKETYPQFQAPASFPTVTNFGTITISVLYTYSIENIYILTSIRSPPVPSK